MQHKGIGIIAILLGWTTLIWGQTDTPKLTAAEEQALRSSAAPTTDTLLQVSKGEFNIHFSQVQLSNWAAGGQSNISLLTKFDQNWNYDQGRFGWDSELHLAFGLLHRPEDRVIIKTDDRIEWSTKLGYRTTESGFVTFMAHFHVAIRPGLRDGKWHPCTRHFEFKLPRARLRGLGRWHGLQNPQRRTGVVLGSHHHQIHLGAR